MKHEMDGATAGASNGDSSRGPSTVAVVGGLALAYFVTGWVGLLVATGPGNVSALWPPSGIALAVVLAYGRRAWPGILIGSVLMNMFFFPAPRPGLESFFGPLLIGLGSSVEIVVAAWLVTRFVGARGALSTPDRVLRFALACAGASTFAAATGLIATSTLGVVQPGQRLTFFVTWWLGDAVGMLALAPIGFAEDAPRKRPAALHWVGVLGLTLLTCQLVFGRPLPHPDGTLLPLAWLVLPPAVWAGLKLGARGVALQASLLYLAASWGTVTHRGPMSVMPTALGLVVCDGLLVAAVLTGLLLSAGAAQAHKQNEALHLERRNLEHKVAERTQSLEAANVALTEEISERARLAAELVEAQKREALGRLAGGVAHDFNNLLTVVMAEAGILKASKSASPDVKDSALAILAAASRATELTRQLLAVARRQPGAPKVVDVASALSEARRLLRPLLPETITLDVVTSPCSVRIDPTQLDQVVLNLAINARDAMPRGGTLRIRTMRASLDRQAAEALGLSEGAWVRVDVSDTGDGIDAEVLPRIFEPFFTTKPGGRGTGLGLSTASGIVEQAGGALRVESEKGRGSTFTLWLPCCEPRATSGAPLVVPTASEAARGSTVLVVEDEPLVRRIIVSALEKEGHRVLVASDGEEALSLARASTLDLVVTDVVMPRMGGPELIRTLRAERPLRALFISGYHDQQAELSTEHLLPKPFGATELCDAVRTALHRPAS